MSAQSTPAKQNVVPAPSQRDGVPGETLRAAIIAFIILSMGRPQKPNEVEYLSSILMLKKHYLSIWNTSIMEMD